MAKVITLNHFLRGPMKVRISEDATWWLKERQWTDDDSDGAIYGDCDFTETRDEIDALLAQETTAP